MRIHEIPALRTSIALFVATSVFQLLFLERGASLYDEGSIIAIGDSLSHGGVLYRDLKTFVAPFTYELMGVLYRVFGAHILVGRLILVFAFSTIVVLVHRTFLKLVSPGTAIAGALAIWPIKPLGFPLWSILNYSQVALLFKVAAMWAGVNWLFHRSRRWLVATGLLVGLTLVSKQDFGAQVALGITVAVVFDWWIRSPRTFARLIATLGTLGVCGLAPVLIALAYYSSLGIGTEFLTRTVLHLTAVGAEYGLPFPGFQPWAERGDDLFMIVFAYFPAVFIELAWSGKMNVYDPSQLMPLEAAIKTAYYLPMLAMAWLLANAVLSRRLPAWERSSLVLVPSVGAIALAIIYRPDWIHLMNLYATVVLPVTVGFGRWSDAGGLLRRLVGWVVLLAWLGFGAIATYSICTVYTAPIHSARGRILDVPRKSADIQLVLDYLDAQPDDARIAFLPHNPLFYFLSGRPILTPNDLVMPTLVSGDVDDRELAAAVENVDAVVYNPKIFPTAPAALYEYAPKTTIVLSAQFDADRVLNNTAIVLRKQRAAAPQIVADFWQGSDGSAVEPIRETIIWSDEEAAALGPVFRDHWMVYRVVASQVSVGAERCFSRRHCVDRGEWLSAIPMTHPEGWGIPAEKRVRFDLRVNDGGASRRLYSSVVGSARISDRVEVPLDAFAGRCVDISFCSEALDANVPRGLAGWAEPAIRGGRFGD